MALQSNVFQLFDMRRSRLLLVEMKQNLYTGYILLEKTTVQFLCTYITRRRCNSVFAKIILIVISRLLSHGIIQNFIWNICTARDDIEKVSVIVPHQGAVQLLFFENSCDSHDLASIAWNNTKLNIRYTYYKALHSCILCTNNSLGGSAMRL